MTTQATATVKAEDGRFTVTFVDADGNHLLGGEASLVTNSDDLRECLDWAVANFGALIVLPRGADLATQISEADKATGVTSSLAHLIRGNSPHGNFPWPLPASH